MERLLARLERRFGRFAIPNLPVFVVGGMGLAYVGAMARPELLDAMALDWDLVLRGQVWRLVSWIFLPPASSPIWLLFALYMFWLVGSALEREWGSFKLGAFYLLGILGTDLAGLVSGHPMSNWQLNMSMFLAYATLFPDQVFTLFFILPVRVKWLGILDALLLVYFFVVGGWGARAGIIAAFANYVLFFAGHWWDYWKDRNLRVRQAGRRAAGEGAPAPKAGGRRCAICGASEDDGADIRVCTCEKCGGKPRTLCLEHARNH